jgi:hypothetical protein
MVEFRVYQIDPGLDAKSAQEKLNFILRDLQKRINTSSLTPGAPGPAGVPGAPGAPGAPGHSPILIWSGDQIAIDGSITGPHLTGPAGPPGPIGIGNPGLVIAIGNRAYLGGS